MNNARKALISIQTAPPGIPVGRFLPQLAIIADYFDSLVNAQVINEALRRELLEAHERFGKLLGEITTPAGSKVDQAQQAASGITGTRPTCAIMDDIDHFTDPSERRSSAVRISEKILANLPNLDITKLPIKDPDNINARYGKFGTPPLPTRQTCVRCHGLPAPTELCRHA